MPPARACKIRAVHTQGGAIRADLNRETQLHGLAVTGGVVSTTGVAGLTLGGGLGWLMSKYGLALGNLLSVELVTADGKVRQVSVEEEPDLFWAVRGGGGNFRVATSFEFQRVQGLISAAGNPTIDGRQLFPPTPGNFCQLLNRALQQRAAHCPIIL